MVITHQTVKVCWQTYHFCKMLLIHIVNTVSSYCDEKLTPSHEYFQSRNWNIIMFITVIFLKGQFSSFFTFLIFHRFQVKKETKFFKLKGKQEFLYTIFLSFFCTLQRKFFCYTSFSVKVAWESYEMSLVLPPRR